MNKTNSVELINLLMQTINEKGVEKTKMLNLNKALTSRGIKYIGELSTNIPHEKKQISKKNKINNEIIIFVENNT